jgi:hypothetical protein
MQLGTVLIVVLALSLAWVAPLMAASGNRSADPDRGAWPANGVSGLILLLLMAFMLARSPAFGVDSIAYVEGFGDYCMGIEPLRPELSFDIAHALMNGVMFGRCDPAWMPAAWVGVIAVGLCLMAAAQTEIPRLRFSALLLLSLVGIELLTNAMRQGMAIAFFAAALCHWPRQRVLALALVFLAIALHESMGLAALALLLSMLRWRWFLPAFGLLLTGTGWVLANEADARLLEPFFYEIRKYLGHEDDEIWVRALAFATLLSAIAAPWIAATSNRGSLWRSAQHQQALRVAATCLPFMALPWFGYRYVYAVYPLVLALTLSNPTSKPVALRHFFLLLFFNALLLVAWSQGSSLIRETPFLSPFL